MDDPREPRQAGAAAGLCAACRHARIVTSDRGSRFVRCARADADPAYAKYPRLPVVRCAGCEPGASPGPGGTG